MAGLPESPLDIDEIMREWLMALEYVARTMRKGTDESNHVPTDPAPTNGQPREVERYSPAKHRKALPR